jgi:uncharacterized protein HemY
LILSGHQTEAETVINRLERLKDPKLVSRRLAEISWHLVQKAAPRSFPPEYALKLAERALAVQPDLDYAWHVLGMAHYRTGSWDAAVKALERANALAHDTGSALNGFFLAMAYHQMVDREQARSWFDRSVTWMDEHNTTDPNAFEYEAEAATLLGVKLPERHRATKRLAK